MQFGLSLQNRHRQTYHCDAFSTRERDRLRGRLAVGKRHGLASRHWIYLTLDRPVVHKMESYGTGNAHATWTAMAKHGERHNGQIRSRQKAQVETTRRELHGAVSRCLLDIIRFSFDVVTLADIEVIYLSVMNPLWMVVEHTASTSSSFHA